MSTGKRPAFQDPNGTSILLSLILVGLSIFPPQAGSLQAQNTTEAPRGIAWLPRGSWQVDGNGVQILEGDSVQPGSLLLPRMGATNPSISIFLPDGQSILYDCFTAVDCARGFRVPELNGQPDTFAVDMLARIQATLLQGRSKRAVDGAAEGSPAARTTQLPRDEIVAVLDPGNQVQIAGLAAKLPTGSYSYDLKPFDSSLPRRPNLFADKNGASISLTLPSAGLYAVTISDSSKRARIDLEIAAVDRAHAENVTQLFGKARTQLKQWNDDYGWPVHPFLRAYMESLMLDVKPPSYSEALDITGKVESNAGAVAADLHRSSTAGRAGATAEPAFSPEPGYLTSNTQVALQCGTPGAVIHYTIDGAQPHESSPVYGAPIVVQARGLTIKAFASAPGKKDSPVVTGDFRFR